MSCASFILNMGLVSATMLPKTAQRLWAQVLHPMVVPHRCVPCSWKLHAEPIGHSSIMA